MCRSLKEMTKQESERDTRRQAAGQTDADGGGFVPEKAGPTD